MVTVLATPDAPETLEQLKELLKDDIKVKVAGKMHATPDKLPHEFGFVGVDGEQLTRLHHCEETYVSVI
jgi:hypothetical protein